MKFTYGRADFGKLDRGQENCYLLTNGLGGFSSNTIVGSSTRNDHALFMASIKAPNQRWHLLTKTSEVLNDDNKSYELTSQEYVNYTKNQRGFAYLNQFEMEYYPTWEYQVNGVTIEKTIVMKQNENTIGISYHIYNQTSKPYNFFVTPYMQFVKKGDTLNKNQIFTTTDHNISSEGVILHYKTNGKIGLYETKYIDDLYYGYDARDGRNSIGAVAHNHKIQFEIQPYEDHTFYVIYSLSPVEDTVENMMKEEKKHLDDLVSESFVRHHIGQELVKSASKFVVNRESTNGKTMIAGYPFFADWGRDTMIALTGCCISSRQFEETKSMFRTFMKYCKKGIMPNIFPEGREEAFYNTVDASLLFICAVYEYYEASNDIGFIKEAMPVMKDIVYWYKAGTDYSIAMDKDGLIMAGEDMMQLTWMDVRIEDVLPTPRHGKPVEINAYWFNSLKIMELFSKLFNDSGKEYGDLALMVQGSFNQLFWNEKTSCLRDVISNTKSDDQIRCNQIWAVSLPFSILSLEKEKQVVDTVFEKLYTPYGLRTLSPDDKEFQPFYGGSQFNRDMAYHQGTVWPFPMGAYYLAYLKVNGYSIEAVNRVKKQLDALGPCLREGCVGQLAEIYDGQYPRDSKGCFAQAWSVGELLRVYVKLEQLESC